MVPDSLTLVLIGSGAVGLALWYASRSFERHREIADVVKGATGMTQKRDGSLESVGQRSVALMNELPPRLQPGWMERQLEENMAVFRASPGLLNTWLLALRDRYRTPLEIEIYKNAVEKIKTYRTLIDEAARLRADEQAAGERVEKYRLQQLTEYEEVKEKYDTVTARGPIIAEKAREDAETARFTAQNARLTAEIANRELRKKLEQADRPPAPALGDRFADEKHEWEHKKHVAGAEAEIASAKAKTKHEQAKADLAAAAATKAQYEAEQLRPKPPPPPPPPRDPHAEALEAIRKRIAAIRTHARAYIELLRAQADDLEGVPEGSPEYVAIHDLYERAMEEIKAK